MGAIDVIPCHSPYIFLGIFAIEIVGLEPVRQFSNEESLKGNLFL
jgi:hypothetical protein